MKKIVIIEGGPRRNMNTAQMLQKFAEGAQSAEAGIEVKTYRLYDLDYKGCMSCMACKVKGKASNICKFKDTLTPHFGRDSPGRRACTGVAHILWRCHRPDAHFSGAPLLPLALLQ